MNGERTPARLFDRIVHHGEDSSEVFFEDDVDSDGSGPWTVIALPGSATPIDDLHSGDLVVQRALGEANLASLRVVDEDVDPPSLYQDDGVIRHDTMVLRETGRVRSASVDTWTLPDERDSEDVPSVVGSPRRTATEWHAAAKAGFLGKLPPRTKSGPRGSGVLTSMMVPASDPKNWDSNQKARLSRDETIFNEIVNGNIPRFLRQGTVVTVTFTGKDKKEHTIHYQVMREYLTVGNTRDHVIVPLIPATAQRIADRFGCILPTRKMVDQIFNAAGVKLGAKPRDYWMQGQTDRTTGRKAPVYDPAKDTKLATHEYDEYLKKSDCQISTAAYLEHDLAIRKQLKDEEGIERGNDMPLIAGHKKDLVIAKNARKDKLQAYGWFKVTKKPDGTKVGTPIQNFVETAHDPLYVDYSHAARLVAGTMLVDDTEMSAAEVLAHDVYSWGLNTDGPITSPRVPNVAVPTTAESAEVAPDVRTRPGGVVVPAIASKPALEICSRFGKPMANARWEVHQNGKVFKGGTDPNGSTGPIDRAGNGFDPQQPFRLHVEGCVCTIVKGAALVTSDPSVEYGGQFVDWSQADDPDFQKQSAFWDEYRKARALRERLSVFSFLQQDHVMRRPVKLLARHTRATFEAQPLSIRLGPIVRYVDQRRALIWLELDTPGLARVTYGKAPNQIALPGPSDAPAAPTDRFSTSVRVGGRHYVLVWLDGLEADTVYQYTITLAPQPAMGSLPSAQEDFTEAVFPRSPMFGGPGSTKSDLSLASLSQSEWLFFRSAARRGDALRFAHGSCRKWPMDHDAKKKVPGPDMLAAFGDKWLGTKTWAEWPQFILHTGDQIYADDVGIRMANAIVKHRFGAVVPGPDADSLTSGAWAGRFSHRFVRVGQEPKITDDLDRLRAMHPRVTGDSEHDLAHAIKRALAARKQAEFLNQVGALPLQFRHRVMNGLLWEVPDRLDEVPSVTLKRGLQVAKIYRSAGPPAAEFRIEYPCAGETGAVHAADYAEWSALYEQAWSLQGARRVLAHVPSFMIFDDHEVTDDWNADPEWLKIIHAKRDAHRYWPTTMTDALCAYWIYQGWGNLAPEAWASDPRVQILERCRQQGRDALPELRRLISARAIETTAPGASIANKLDWHFAIPTEGIPFLMIDLRTDRDVNGTGGMSPGRLRWMEQALATTQSPVAIVVLPVPYLMPDPMLFAFRHPGFVARLAGARSTTSFTRDSDIEHPAGNPVWDQIKGCLARLQQSSSTLKTLVIISGDIHFSCNLDGQLPNAHKAPRLVQLVSSGLKQAISQSKKDKLHSAYKGWLNVISGATGVDVHRGMRITLGGLRGPGGSLDNFLFKTSIAMVHITTTRSTRTTPVSLPLVQQTHLALDSSHQQIEAYTFMHMTQRDGKALMSLKDPGMGHPFGPKDYPVAPTGVGTTREIVVEEGIEYVTIEPSEEVAGLGTM